MLQALYDVTMLFVSARQNNMDTFDLYYNFDNESRKDSLTQKALIKHLNY